MKDQHDKEKAHHHQDAGVASQTKDLKSEEKNETAKREERILSYWREKTIFEKTLKKSSPEGNWVFYDGPPYATGMPHFGHILPTTLKDVFPRYKTMQGYHVERRWGWDCHGLPIENLVEKELGLKNKKEIEEYGIANFNKKARESVVRYVDEWKSIIPRLGRFVDMENDYRTMDASFMESVWWTFKSLCNKELVYEGFKVMYICSRCGTPVSNSEVSIGGYKDITDISVFVAFKLREEFMGHKDVSILAWTTTPWTLPGNTAVAVNFALDYVLIQTKDKNAVDHKLILAKERLEVIKSEYTVLAEFKGSELVDLAYSPVFPYYEKEGSIVKGQEEKRTNAWKIYSGEFVTATDGTGVVHIAPGFGEDDLALANKVNLPVIQHVGMDGLMKSEVVDFAGLPVKPKAANPNDHQQTDIEIIKYLAKTGSLFEKLKLVHPYPHCWRCETPLLNYATTAWFVKVSQYRDRMVELNKKIKWLPAEIGEGRFGRWLEGARDWNVSRSRYWGTPLPIWRNEKGDHIEVCGSIDDLKKKINNRGNKYVVMRHGESVSNVLGIINDNNEIKKCPLTDKGIKEVKASAEVLKKTIQEKGLKVGHIYTSPLIRTQETAHLTADVLGFSKDEIITDSRLREINCGILSGQPISEYQNYFTDPEEKMRKPIPNGESNADVKKRIAEFFYDIDSKHENELIVVVTHGLPLHFVKEISEGRTVRDLLRIGWKDMPEHTGSHHWIDFVSLPHNEEFEFDLHRPYIDEVTWKNDKGELMKRVPEVFDVWYDSGSMPYAQNHYPFENKEAFEKKGGALFPADFIAEGLDQTRGWFYSLVNLSTPIFDVAPFKNVVVNGLILAEDGRKMSKSLNNFPPLIPTVEKYGADALRFYNASSPSVRAEEVKFSEKNLDEVNKKVFMRLANVLTFYESYSDSRKNKTFTKPKSIKHILDKWILARLNQMGKDVTEYLDVYQIDKAARSISDFIDDMSTWYLRRSRDRFKSMDDKDKQNALDTTAYVLYTVAHVLAPFAPFFAEDLYLKLTGEKELESVHLSTWPKFDKIDQAVIDNTKEVRSVVEKALSMRSKAGIKVRQPLGFLTLNKSVHGLFAEKDYSEILKDEINVKEIVLRDLSAEAAEGGEGMILDTVLTEELKNEGRVRELTRGVQELRKQSGLSVHDEIILHVSSANAFTEVLKNFSAEIAPVINAKEIQIGELHLVDGFIASQQNILGTESLDLDGTHARIVLLRVN